MYRLCEKLSEKYGSETRLMRMECEVMLDRTEMSIIRWMFPLTDKKAELSQR